MKTELNIKANKLIDERNKITNEIANLWRIIATENVIKKNMKRNYDMKSVLLRIKHLYEQSIIVKLRIQCANLGMKIKNLPSNANIINIYKLSAYNEFYVKLDEMIKKHTINPAVKIKKGKKALSVTEELTRPYLEKIKADYSLMINKIRKAIEDFNNNTDLTDDTVPLFLVV